MSGPVVGVDVERLDLLILLRLASPVKRASQLRSSLERWVVPPVPRAEWPSVFEARVDVLGARGWVSGREATPDGRRALAERLGGHTPEWRRSRATIAALALGLSAPPTPSADALAAHVLDHAYDLELPTPTLARVADRLAHEELTGASGVLTLNAARKVLLERLLGRPVGGDWAAAARALAAKQLGVVGSEPEQLVAGLSAQWLAAESADNVKDHDPLLVFAEGAKQAARRVPDSGRYGRTRVYLVSLYEQSRALPYADGLDLASFKHRLVHAHRAGLLALHRADLVSAMDPRLLRESEVQYLNATFHFLGTEPVRSHS